MKNVSLEKVAPNVYGWLVWGGGMYTIAQAMKVFMAIGIVAAVFLLGVAAGNYL